MTTKPGVSLQRIGLLPSRAANASAVSNGVVGRELRAHDLDERHQRRRVEEVHADDALGRDVAAAIAVTDSADVLVARIVSAPADPLELGEERLLRLELLDDRLDHEVAVGEVGELGRQR